MSSALWKETVTEIVSDNDNVHVMHVSTQIDELSQLIRLKIKAAFDVLTPDCRTAVRDRRCFWSLVSVSVSRSYEYSYITYTLSVHCVCA